MRPLRAGDAEAVIRVDRVSTGTEKAGFWRGMIAAHLEGQGEAPGGDEAAPAPTEILSPRFFQVADDAGRVVGFAVGDVQAWQFGIPRCGRIVALAVDPEHRRHGVGAALAGSLVQVFRDLRVPLVQCLVRPGDPLEALFGSVGFGATDWRILELRP